jgi:branched-chain amino acid transport system permease protein
MTAGVRLRIALPALLVLAGASYLLFPDYLSLLRTIFIVAILALSYDLLQGHAGIVSLGHAVFFGLGAYTVAILGNHGWHEPLLTLHGLTGGADGLSSFQVGPLAGVFAFDFQGHVAFFYTLAGLVVAYLVVWRVVTSPFGLALRGLRENTARMHAIGALVPRHRAQAYVLSGALAGMAGAMLAQTSNFASLDMLGFERSADLVLMTALGGTGSIPGVVLGASVFTWIKDALSSLSPKYWQLGVGLALMASVFVLPRGLAGLWETLLRRARRRT